MNILVLASYYPHSSRPFGGIFIERCVAVLKQFCTKIEVMAPRPYTPPLLSTLIPRWQTYSNIQPREFRNGILVCRPTYFQLPRMGSAFWSDRGAFLCCRHVAKRMHRSTRFDLILSFDLAGAGGLAWRLGRELGIPAAGWAFGDDVRVARLSSLGRVVRQALERLDIVFYQSGELREKSAEILGTVAEKLDSRRHVILSHGIPEPPRLPRVEIRARLRRDLGLKDDDVLVLSIGRISREKGIFELIEAVSLVSTTHASIVCLIVGSAPSFDDSVQFKRQLSCSPHLKENIRVLPACRPEKVWEYLCAADIFAFTSHREGMPNSLLEAMAMGVPAIAFGIPPILEIEASQGAPLIVSPFQTKEFAAAILQLASSPAERSRTAEIGKQRVLDRYMVRNNMAEAFRRLSELVPNRPLATGIATALS